MSGLVVGGSNSSTGKVQTMLVMSATPRIENRRCLAVAAWRKEVPIKLAIGAGQIELVSLPWREYWAPCLPFFSVDYRLIQRLNRLKAAWLAMHRASRTRRCVAQYVWRYFGLLHHVLEIARCEPHRGDPMPALRHTVGFSNFAVTREGYDKVAAATFAEFNPVYLLGRLPGKCPPPTPRHVALVLPPGQDRAFYCYRQLVLSGKTSTRLLVFPSTDLPERSGSLEIIDRLTRMLSPKPDPYWRPRARLLSRRAFAPIVQNWASQTGRNRRETVLRILDLGAGTGHVVVRAWRALREVLRSQGVRAAFHFVDASEPTYGRSFGLSGPGGDIEHIEWTRADCRRLLDDDGWLAANGSFDLAVLCRLLDNCSNFEIEAVNVEGEDVAERVKRSDPSRCLAPRHRLSAIENLSVRTTRRKTLGGTVMPQHSLASYFRVIRGVSTGAVGAGETPRPCLPVRRFNPACLTTLSGRSIIAQIMKSADVIVIEDMDLDPDHLQVHRAQFGLSGTTCVHLVRDGFRTEANHFVLGRAEFVESLPGERMW